MAKKQNPINHDCKILSVVWYKVLPAKFGGQKAIALFNEHLAAFAPLICLCSKNNEKAKSSYQIENSLPVGKSQFINPLVWWKIHQSVRKNGITHLLLEFPYHGIAAAICRRFLGVKLILNTHNIEHLRFRDLGKWWWKILYYVERWTMRESDLVLFKTASDRAIAIKRFSLPEKKTAVIPYGANDHGSRKATKEIIQQRHLIDHKEKIFLFAGTLDYHPNAQAVTDIREKLIPILSKSGIPFRIIICGRNHSPSFHYLSGISHSAVILAGEVEDIDNYFAAADVFIDPVLSGGGIQTKIIDALSYHVTVVAFESKANDILEAGSKLRIVSDEDWNAFATAVLQSANRPSETPSAFFKKYNWRSIAADAYQKICSA